MEKKQLINLLFEVVERLIFPTENKAGEKNPASVKILTFFKEVLREIKKEETLDIFLNDWTRVSGRIKRIIDYPISFSNEEIELIYDEINQEISSKEKIMDNSNDESSLVKKISDDLPGLLQEGLNLQGTWNQNKKTDFDEFFEEEYFKKLKSVFLPGTKKNRFGIYEVNPNIEPCLDFILKTSKSFRLNSNRKKFYPLWEELRDYLFSYFKNEKRSYLFNPKWTDLIFEINSLLKNEIDSSKEETGFYIFYHKEYDIFIEKMEKSKKQWIS